VRRLAKEATSGEEVVRYSESEEWEEIDEEKFCDENNLDYAVTFHADIQGESGGKVYILGGEDRERWRAFVNAVMNLRVP
jgi:hypothetical protein